MTTGDVTRNIAIAQLVEHCSAAAEAMGSNLVETLNLQLLEFRSQLR